MKEFKSEVLEWLDNYNWEYSILNHKHKNVKYNIDTKWPITNLSALDNNTYNSFSETILTQMVKLAENKDYSFFTYDTINLFLNNIKVWEADTVLVKEDGSLYGFGWTWAEEQRIFGIRFQKINEKFELTDLYENFFTIKPKDDLNADIAMCAGIEIDTKNLQINSIYPPGMMDKYSINNVLLRKHKQMSEMKTPCKSIFKYMKLNFKLFAKSYKEELKCIVYYFTAPPEITKILHQKLKGILNE